MKESGNRFYFPTVKLCCILIIIIYYISSSEKSLHAISMEWFLLAVTMAAVLGFELMNNQTSDQNHEQGFYFKNLFTSGASKKKIFFLVAEIILTFVLILFYSRSDSGLYLLPMAVWDTVIFFRLPFALGMLSLAGVLLHPGNVYVYLFYCLFIMIIYFQNFIIIEKYRKYLNDFEQEEYELKDSIRSQNFIYKEQLKESSLSFENRMLEEKDRLSQALHDKLGHSINGSVYQLEACKVLMEKEPEQSRQIIQAVIDNLRTSMDEIRMILRREKPDKGRMAYLKLVQLCAECKEKYGIEASIKIQGEDKEIPELIWETILDNSIEAVTNSFKYAGCTRILIDISILNKVIRCNISDNGSGCYSLKEGMGIQGMKNRIRNANGYIDISSEEGFHINMIFPL